MFAFNSMKKSLEYIEDHLTEKLEIKDIASIAAYSPFHYQRLFQILTGYTIGEYIRYRRMSHAAQELSVTDIKVIDLAYKYQYESPEAFSRAFKRIFDISPSAVRKKDVKLKNYPALSIEVQMVAKPPLEYEIVTKEAFVIEGYKTTFTAEEIMAGKAYGQFVRKVRHDVDKIMSRNSNYSLITAGSYRIDDCNYYDAIVGTFTKSPQVESLLVAKGKWCVFKGKGPLRESLHDLWVRIFTEWFPMTNFQHSGSTELEVFYPGDQTAEDYYYEIWIPVRS